MTTDTSPDFLTRAETDEDWRRAEFPACRDDRVFLAHAAVAALPSGTVRAMDEFNRASSTGEIDYSKLFLRDLEAVRGSAARLLDAEPEGIALLGPTSLGLSLVANGIDWREGDEIITYLDDYPANVYPWKALEERGVRTVFLQPGETGRITPELVEAAITPRTRLLALASCHFLTGYRLDAEAIGEIARKRDILFCLDAIQTAGAFPTPASAVDFLSADSHKWMLGPMTAGIFYVDPEKFGQLRPSLLGAWNVKSPNFVAQDRVEFEEGGRRYEPGVLNAPGLFGMKVSLDLLTGIGIGNVARRLLDLKAALREGLESQGLRLIGPKGGSEATAITTFTDPDEPARTNRIFQSLLDEKVTASFRHGRDGVPYIRFSPHFYNTHAELERVLGFVAGIR